MSEKNLEIREEIFLGDEEIFAPKNYSNRAEVSGILEKDFEYGHEVYGENFYQNRVRVARISGTEDYVPILVSEILIPNILEENFEGKQVKVIGEFRSYNEIKDDGKSHLKLYLFVKSFEICENETEVTNINGIYLNGYICKQPTYRTTPFGREITDLLIAVNRRNKKADYIPCITWGRSAVYAQGLKVGSRIELYGRIQSREYIKKYPDDSEEYKEVYEISINKLREVFTDSDK